MPPRAMRRWCPDWPTICEVIAVGIYSKDDLFTLWLNFRGQHDELRMMQDFALCDQKEAQALIADFETRLECATIDGDHRGKEFRVEYGKPAKPKKATKTAPPPNPKYQPFRDRFPELSALLDGAKPPTGGTPRTTLIDRKTAERIVKEAQESAEIK